MNKIGKKLYLIFGLALVALIISCTSMPQGYVNTVAGMLGLTTEVLNKSVASSYVEMSNEAKQKRILDESSETAKRVKKIFKRMQPLAEQANQTGVPFDWEVKVFRSKQLNAFAMPGGKMVFYSGIVETLELTDDEIATIMGHEMAHAFKEHGKQRIVQKVSTGVAVGVLSRHVAITGNAGLDGILYGLTSKFGLDLPFSRANETEADAEGLILMAKAGYDPRQAVNLWHKMEKHGGSKSSTFMSTHPSHGKRIDNLNKLMPTALPYYYNTKKAS